MFSKFKNIIAQKKPSPTPVKTEPKEDKPPAPPAPPRHSQYDKQLEKLRYLYRILKINPWNDDVEKSLQNLLDSLQEYTISDYLASSYSNEKLDEYKAYALKEFEAMGATNRKRVQSLVELSDEDMHKSIYECLFLCDVNPEDQTPFELSETHGFDLKGNPILEKNIYSVFVENTLAGIDGIHRFLPVDMIEGNSEKNIQGMNKFLEGEYKEIASQAGSNTEPIIKAMTTIGSLGGIGHKPDSDMDLQVIFNTNPEYDFRWNDADFFIALLTQIFHNLQNNFLEKTIPEDKRQALKTKVVEQLREKFWNTLKEDELRILTKIFPSTYKKALEKEVWEAFNKLKPPQQGTLLYRQLTQDLPKVPYLEIFLPQIKVCLPLVKTINLDKFLLNCFPYSAKVLSLEKVNSWLSKYYQKQFLGKNGTQKVIRAAAHKNSIPLSDIKGDTLIKLILEHLNQSKIRATIIKGFLADTASRFSLKYKDKLAEVVDLVQKQYDPNSRFIKSDANKELQLTVTHHFRNQMVNLIDVFSDLEAAEMESKSESAIHQKIQMIEAYLTQKYPNTEIHLFTNILRNQRQGQHTPFLVSPEGSMAYSLMLNDFLLNPAVVLAGMSPMPFDLPHELKVMLTTGILPSDEWTLAQSKGEESPESFNIQKLVDWGNTQISQEKLWAHAIPIYLRESEKVSHRNLPKALLNCWWLEMLCCSDSDYTSLTRLLWNPQNRHFIKHKMEGRFITKIEKIEKEFPQLIRDPWWVKYTEMMSRFDDPKIQKQIIFCFSQHIRLTDIIDFNNECKPIWLDKKVNWRTKALILFYELFYDDQKERIDLMNFAQGRDDIGNLMEEKLKESFITSMTTTEKKLIDHGNKKALKLIVKYLNKLGREDTSDKTIETTTWKYLKEINRHLIIADESVLQKAKSSEPLDMIEQRQLDILQKDRLQISQILEDLTKYYEGLNLKASPKTLTKYILDSRIKLAGDPLENVIFNYHFERNFKRKPYQVPLPISKSLSIPRKKISLEFSPTSQNWIYKSIMSKQDRRKDESEMEMFNASIVEGLARCVFSGYVGFTTKNLTSFEKPVAHHKSSVSSNPITHQDIQDLAFAIHGFFPPHSIRPQELLENIHYIIEVFMVLGVNYPGSVTLIMRDNFGDNFVIDYDISKIKVKIPQKELITHDEAFPRMYLQLHSKEARAMFQRAFDKINIPLDSQNQPQFKVWVNFGHFDLTVAPKLYRDYVNGIAEAIMPANTIGTTHQRPHKLPKTLDQLGKDAIQRYQKIEAERKALIEKSRQKDAIKARAYLDRKRNEHDR